MSHTRDGNDSSPQTKILHGYSCPDKFGNSQSQKMFPKTVHSRYGIRVKVSWSGPEGAFGSPAASPVASCGSKTWGESAGGEFRNSHHAWLGQQYIPWLGKQNGTIHCVRMVPQCTDGPAARGVCTFRGCVGAPAQTQRRLVVHAPRGLGLTCRQQTQTTNTNSAQA